LAVAGLLQVHGEVAAELGGVLDDSQNVQTGTGEGRNFEEVARKQGACLTAQERGPGGGGPPDRRVDAVRFEDLPHRGGGDLDTECGQLTVNAPIAP
jgi:hypothetical protein